MSIFNNPNDLAAYADTLKKPTKKEAHQLLIDIACDRVSEGRKADALARLYLFFMPPVPARPKTALDWCSKALPKNDIRLYLNYIHSDGSRIMGCDGKRLHIVRDNSLAAGSYDRQGNLVNDPGTYPDVDRLLDVSGLYNMPFGKMLDDSPVGVNQDIPHYDLPIGIRINKKFLDDALAFLDEPTLYYMDDGDKIVLKDGPKSAVIMGIWK